MQGQLKRLALDDGHLAAFRPVPKIKPGEVHRFHLSGVVELGTLHTEGVFDVEADGDERALWRQFVGQDASRGRIGDDPFGFIGNELSINH